MSNTIRCDVLVVGGGHAGLMLGAALAHMGFAVRLIERQPLAAIEAAPADGRSLALLAGSVRIAKELGVWPKIAAHTAEIERVEVVDVEGGGRVRYDSRSHGKGPFGVGIEHGRLRKGLLGAFLAEAGHDAWLAGEVAELRREAGVIAARLTDGRTVAAPLVVGADGRGSRVRELARIGVDRWTYGQHALTFVLRHDRPHHGAVHEWLRRGGPLATLPLPGRRTGITWVEPSAEALRLLALEPGEILALFTERSGGVLGRVEIESGPSAYPLGAQHAHRYVAPRLALVGDAAHGVHPIHAQGFNMGVADIGALAEALQAARARGLDLGSGETLLPYARRRRADNMQRLWLTDGLIRVFTNDLPPLKAARSLALGAIERVAPLKRLAVRHGMQTG
ncbi:FAD-dependent monooxygenase [Benzoatithermus flavus]|uniref:FAD-dependent monooxygenase n=1 Tax=Benzoatithermus flavus TaxID=3108223 RepID=A0ABU8XQ91_9PROT